MAGHKRIMIVTGEASGDLHGAKLIRACRAIDPAAEFFGVGGARMQAEGCDLLVDGETIAVMGLVEVLGHFPVIWSAFQKLKKVLHGPERPDALVLIDFPEFNLRLARQAQRAGVPVLYFVSPQVWAWRRGRVRKIAALVDRLAAIFPFEPALYEGLDIQVEYVGHPLLDEYRITRERREFLEACGLDPAHTVIGLFPGSRRSELKYMLDTLVGTAHILAAEYPAVQFVVPVAAGLDQQVLVDRFGPDLPVTFLRDEIYDVANACDVVVSVSGTVTLQTALTATPMVLFYKLAPLSYQIGRHLVRVDHIGLANIVANRRVVPEFIQDDATPENLAGEVTRILTDATYREEMVEGLKGIRSLLGEPGCSARVACMLFDMLNSERIDQHR